MTNQEPPKIEFPCEDYPIKVLGDANDSFRSDVLSVMDKHAPGYDPAKVTVKDSRNGRFNSITVFICATGVPQLEDIFEDLKKLPQTKMVL